MSTYNALLVSLNRRYRNGLSLQVSYTWEKNLTDAESAHPEPTTIQNPPIFTKKRPLSARPATNLCDLAPLYQLPLGKGKKYLNHGLASYLAGGWEIGTIQRYESGTPIAFCCATVIPGWDNNIRYNRVPGQSLKCGISFGQVEPVCRVERAPSSMLRPLVIPTALPIGVPEPIPLATHLGSQER